MGHRQFRAKSWAKERVAYPLSIGVDLVCEHRAAFYGALSADYYGEATIRTLTIAVSRRSGNCQPTGARRAGQDRAAPERSEGQS